jgi:lipopolysaccharide export LptBFGC system permease protein LptF
MVTLGALSDSGEVMALRAAGFSFFEIAKPFLWLGVALSALLLLINHKSGPEGYHSFRRQTSEAGQKMAKIDLRPRQFTPIGPWRLYAREADSLTGRLEGVYLIKPDRKEPARVDARRGTLTLEPGLGVDLSLQDGELVLPNGDPTHFTSGKFERYEVFLPAVENEAPRELDMQELTTRDLRERIADAGTKVERRLEYAVEVAARSAGALSPFVFFWVAAPLGRGLKRRVYYGLLVVGISLGRRHELLAPTAPWLADAVGLAIGAWLTRRAAAQ